MSVDGSFHIDIIVKQFWVKFVVSFWYIIIGDEPQKLFIECLVVSC